MKKFTRIIVAVLSITLVIAYFVPMWFIDLEAPQYPEGLGLKIWLSKMSGDLDTINNLNHYIGMKKIYPESIPELKLMPFLLGILIAMGLAVAAAGKKWLFTVYIAIFLTFGTAGGIDFYLWGYDYGHDLDPRAAIKVPGMSYQPPVFGSKKLLNFTAHSYPDIGGTIIISCGLIMACLLVFELFRSKSISKSMRKTSKKGIKESPDFEYDLKNVVMVKGH